MIRMGPSLLVIRHRLTDTWDVPGGRGDDETSAQCTAHRETFEETGLNVLVGPFLGSSETAHFYACSQQSGFTEQDMELSIPIWANTEVSRIALKDPFELHPNEWRFGDQLIMVRTLFSNIDIEESDNIKNE
ncbi:NUDIX hydrolase [Aestuariibacter salexigens]|uniref:NUDIX hydrolase n=1 Tax=Aestuariibacter salexigens TaxID=226010 RepID=UPI00042511D9|nr:NUDIX hydrolase [Aestuariibacter salexigens]